ncbi:sulfotransferase domain-containing protein [bacterium]|nr:sulfotransferase domain-containing protein [bacterium]
MAGEKAYPKGGSLAVFGPTERIPGLGLIYQNFRGKRYPPFINLDSTRRLMSEWETDRHDIIICTHQKVGTHLTKKFVVEILRALHEFPEGSGMAKGDIGHDTVPWPEVMASQHGVDAMLSFVEKTKGHPRVWYTHCCREDLPVHRIHPETRFIIVVRDPRAAILSQYHFYRNHPLLGADEDLSMDKLSRHFVNGTLYFGGYHEHALSWMNKARSEIKLENALFLRYEELVEDKMSAARLLAKFLVPDRVASDDVLARVVAATAFDTMKQTLSENPQSFHFNPSVFFRKGETEEWRDALPTHIQNAIDEKSHRLWGDRYTGGPNWSEFPSLASELNRLSASASADLAGHLPLDVSHILVRDLQDLAAEIRSTPAEDLWRTLPGVTNSVGTLAWHMCGNLRHFIGAVLGGDGYVRQREAEFTTTGLTHDELVAEIESTAAAVAVALDGLDPNRLAEEMPVTPPQHKGRTIGYFLIQLVAHFQRHRGQLNYLRRMLS